MRASLLNPYQAGVWCPARTLPEVSDLHARRRRGRATVVLSRGVYEVSLNRGLGAQRVLRQGLVRLPQFSNHLIGTAPLCHGTVQRRFLVAMRAEQIPRKGWGRAVHFGQCHIWTVSIR